MNKLFDATTFVTRDVCGDWNPFLVIINQIANSFVGIVYAIIPVMIFRLYQSKKDIFPKIEVHTAFCTFLFLCGLSHVCNVLAFHWPAYRLFTLIDVFTAGIAITTIIVLPGYFRFLRTLPNLEECNKTLIEKNIADAKRDENYNLLQKQFQAEERKAVRLSERVIQLEQMLDERLWATMTREDLEAMKKKLNEIKRINVNLPPDTTGETTSLQG
jgi:hypothetical protein